jgi:hypothetical protein
MKRRGAFLIALGAGLGLLVAIYNYFSPAGFLSPISDTAGTPGALLVIGSTAIMLVAGVVLAMEPRSRFLTWFAVVGCFIDIIGTSFAAMLLDSTPLLICMAISAIGWLVWMFGPRSAPATA